MCNRVSFAEITLGCTVSFNAVCLVLSCVVKHNLHVVSLLHNLLVLHHDPMMSNCRIECAVNHLQYA